MHGTAATGSQSIPAGQLSVRTMASCYNCCAHSRVHSTFRTCFTSKWTTMRLAVGFCRDSEVGMEVWTAFWNSAYATVRTNLASIKPKHAWTTKEIEARVLQNHCLYRLPGCSDIVLFPVFWRFASYFHANRFLMQVADMVIPVSHGRPTPYMGTG